MSYEVQDFETEVLERSHEVPVLVDFWAAWCGPCRVLGPVIEKVAGEADGEWELAKVDVEAPQHRAVAQGLQIRSIPDVRLFHKGEVIGQFNGALPESQIRKFIEDHLPSEDDHRLTIGASMLDNGELEAGIAVLEGLADSAKAGQEARSLLVKALMIQDPEQAERYAEGLTIGLEYVEDLKVVRRLYSLGEADLPDVPLRTTYLGGIEAMRNGDLSAALERFIEVIMLNKAYDDEGARKACIVMFHHLGEQHPVTQKYRKRFGMALY